MPTVKKTKLTNEELERYARHIVLRDLGGAGQQKLKAARVLVVGAGGLGSPVLQYLAAAGVHCDSSLYWLCLRMEYFQSGTRQGFGSRW